MTDIEQAIEAQETKTNEFMKKRNVVGVGVGYKNALGEDNGQASVVVLVQQKKPLDALSDDDIIPRNVDGMPTDVVEIGFMRAHQQPPTARFRPIIPSGVSMANFRVGAGTLGFIVRHRQTGERFLLSNNHVFASANDAQIGDPILQPSPLDGGNPTSDVVARLHSFRRLAFLEDMPTVPAPQPPQPTPPTPTPTPPPSQPEGGCDLVEATVALANALAQMTGSTKRVQSAQAASMQQNAGANASAQSMQAQQARTGGSPAEAPVPDAADYDNLMDVALAQPTDPTIFSSEILSIGQISNTKAAVLGQTVAKMGRTTGYTEGRITLLNATINVQYDTIAGTRTARFVNQVITSGMSKPGDSGSLVVDPSDKTAVGLLFAGSEFASLFTPINVVFGLLDIEL